MSRPTDVLAAALHRQRQLRRNRRGYVADLLDQLAGAP